MRTQATTTFMQTILPTIRQRAPIDSDAAWNRTEDPRNASPSWRSNGRPPTLRRSQNCKNIVCEELSFNGLSLGRRRGRQPGKIFSSLLSVAGRWPAELLSNSERL